MSKSSATHYAILNIPFTSSALRRTDVKTAYHRALLRHHPDKTKIDSYSIDQITTAYHVLSNPALRTEYDLSLRLDSSLGSPGSTDDADGGGVASDINDAFRTGLEVFDLEDMTQIDDDDAPACTDRHQPGDRGTEANNNDREEEESKSIRWYHPCRCGDPSGFLLSEEDLLSEAEHGEVIIGCEGCSLWAKILFAVEES